MKSRPPARSMVGETTRRLDGLYWDKHDDPAWSTGVDELLPESKLAGVS
ncbi:MAG: hypothetical protein OXC14_03735 [Rhodospirillaceae bacterium]|nr:hypothetical protein [Rhodospirillaceae bacterium]